MPIFTYPSYPFLFAFICFFLIFTSAQKFTYTKKTMLTSQTLIEDIRNIIAQSLDRAIRAVDHERTLMYWHIGKRIFEEEQNGEDRAEYGPS